jgi:hypothetical protein
MKPSIIHTLIHRSGSAAHDSDGFPPGDPRAGDTRRAGGRISPDSSAPEAGADVAAPPHRRHRHLRTWIAAAVALAVIVAGASYAAWSHINADSILSSKIATVYTKEYQAKAAARISARKASHHYTLNDMLVLHNPYGTNTTSLYVYFTTDENTSVRYTVSAPDTDYSDFSAKAYQSKTYQKTHEFSVLGLIPNTTNTIIITVTTQQGTSITRTICYTMGSLLGSEEVQVKRTSGAASSTTLGDGLYAILGNDSDGQDFMFYYDNDGILRGEIPILYYRAHRLLFRNNLMYFSVSTRDIVAMNRLGQITRWYNTSDTYLLHHDYAMDSKGNLIVLATNVTKNTIQDAIITINGRTGKVTQLVDLGDLFPVYKASAKFATMGSSSSSTTNDKSSSFDPDTSSTKKDWIHLNTIQLLDDGSAIVSSRETSTIIKINNIETKPTIGYMIGQTAFWKGTEAATHLLSKDTTDGDWSATGGQHSVTYESDSSLASGQYYLYMFDNNYGSSNTRPDYDWARNVTGIQTSFTTGTHSYYYKYLVDENAGTYKLVSSFAVPYSSIVSSVEEYGDGTVIVDSGTKGVWGAYTHDGTLISQYSMALMKNIIYRVYKYDFHDFYFAS